MEKFLNACVHGVSKLFRFDITNQPQRARRKSLIVLLIIVIGLQVALYWSLLK